jgi:hypothetical protein
MDNIKVILGSIARWCTKKSEKVLWELKPTYTKSKKSHNPKLLTSFFHYVWISFAWHNAMFSTIARKQLVITPVLSNTQG